MQSFDQLEAATELAKRIQQLYNEGYPLSEIAKQLNHERYKPAKQGRFTRTSVGALCRMLRRRGLIATTPHIPPHYWRAGKLCQSLGIKKPTLSGWRHRGWVQVRQVGSRWIYWADPEEFVRLKKLAQHPPNGSTPTPAKLTTPLTKMPLIRATNRDEQSQQGGYCEQAVKGPVMGKKAWLFFGNEQVGHTAAVLYTLTMNCKRHCIDVQAYLPDVFRRIRTATPAELESLLPDRWIQAIRKPGSPSVSKNRTRLRHANANDASGDETPFPADSDSAPLFTPLSWTAKRDCLRQVTATLPYLRRLQRSLRSMVTENGTVPFRVCKLRRSPKRYSSSTGWFPWRNLPRLLHSFSLFRPRLFRVFSTGEGWILEETARQPGKSPPQSTLRRRKYLPLSEFKPSKQSAGYRQQAQGARFGNGCCRRSTAA